MFEKLNMSALLIPKKTNFLAIDDIPTVIDLVAANLRQFGLESKVLLATSVKAAKNTLSKQEESGSPVQFIICDWNMPEETGLDMLKFIRKSEKYKNIPFIMLTTINEKDNIIEAIQCGVSDYIIKPWRPNDMLKKVNEAYKKHLFKD